MHRALVRLAGAWLGALVLVSCGSDAPASEDDLVTHATALHQRLITIDTHDDIPENFATAEVDPGARDGRQVTLPKMREGGLDVAFFVVYAGQTERTPANYAAAEATARAKFAAIHRMAEQLYPDEIAIASTPDDVERIVGDGKLATVIGVENGYVIGQDLSLVRTYFDLGARSMGLTHGGHNDIGDSSTPTERLGDAEEEHGGLSPFGEQYVAELNRLGIMVDVSHAAKSTMLDAIRVSRAPVIASHSSARALANHPRNLDDEQLLALRDNGGVAQMVALDDYVKVQPAKDSARQALRQEMGLTSSRARWEMPDAQRAEYDARVAELDAQWPSPTVADFVNHIDYAVELIGIDHVGISSDFDGGGGIVGWNDASESLNVTIELVRRGYSDEDIQKLWGGNLLRVWREVEQVAGAIRAGG